VALIRSFIIAPFKVVGSSMSDTLKNNEFILIDKLSYHLGEPRRGDPVVFKPPITNKQLHKFEKTITTDKKGIGKLYIGDLRSDKKVFYCHNSLTKMLWLCNEKIKENDIIFYKLNNSSNRWARADKRNVSSDEIKQKEITIEGKPNKKYVMRIYNSVGLDYFVKRIIGIPGDTVRIENERVYLKKKGDKKFNEIDETYLNKENKYSTYPKEMRKANELTIPMGHYFVLGDNRNHSNDSRDWLSPLEEKHTPFVSYKNISGKVLVVLWPPYKLRFISAGVLE